MANARKKAFRNNRRKRKAEKPTGLSMKLLDRFAKFGSLSDYNIEQIVGSSNSDEILKELKGKGLIKDGDKPIKIKRNDINYFKLTKTGISFLKRNNRKIYFSNSPRHDVIHATNVLDNFSEKQIDNYKHEKELYNFSREGVSRVDGAIINEDGTMILIETITRNYTPNHIKAKRAYKDLLGGGGYEYKEFRE